MSLVGLLLASGVAFGAPLPDPDLARQRGGFRLPSGIDVTLTVDTQTAVDGAVVLRSVFKLDRGAPVSTVYAPAAGVVVAATRGATAVTRGASQVRYDPRVGVQVTPVTKTVAVGGGDASPIQDGLIVAGAGAVTDNGVIGVSQAGGTHATTLKEAGLSVTHLAGNAVGSAIANMASDRAIDTRTVLSIDLRDAGPDVLGSTMIRAQDLAAQALIERAD